jgi:CheY-like chemotaxis protein
MTKRIVVIDDEADLRTVIQVALLKYAGWQVSTAATALAGLQLVKTEQPDLVLLDISMPDMDGYQCFETLRAEPSTAEIPVILLTARVLPRDRRQFAQMGIAGVITKPFNPLTLWQQIEKIVWGEPKPSSPGS